MAAIDHAQRIDSLLVVQTSKAGYADPLYEISKVELYQLAGPPPPASRDLRVKELEGKALASADVVNGKATIDLSSLRFDSDNTYVLRGRTGDGVPMGLLDVSALVLRQYQSGRSHGYKKI